MPTRQAAPIDYNSPLWLHVACHIEQHCFGTISHDIEKRTEQLGKERPSRILAAITATASHISKHPGFQRDNGLRRLIQITLIEELPLLTVKAISAFLGTIGDYPSPTVTDYLATIQSIRNLPVATSTVHDAVVQASKLHGSQGQLAYDLLKSASLLLQAAEATLNHDGSYAAEKLRIAHESVKNATHTAWVWQPHLRPSEDDSP